MRTIGSSYGAAELVCQAELSSLRAAPRLAAPPPAPSGSRAWRRAFPPYRPINPVAASRSGLSFEPFHAPRPGRWVADVGARVRQHHRIQRPARRRSSCSTRSCCGSRRPSPATWVRERSCWPRPSCRRGLRRHLRRIAGVVPRSARDRHSRAGAPAAETTFSTPRTWPEGDRWCASRAISSSGDVRLGVGLRVHPRVQSVVALTLPTNTGPEGYGRGVVSASLLNTAAGAAHAAAGLRGQPLRRVHSRARTADRLAARASSFPAAPGCVGASGDANRSTAISFSTSPYYHDTALPALDRRDLSFDFGWILATGSGGGSCGWDDGGPGARRTGDRSGLPGRGEAVRNAEPVS